MSCSAVFASGCQSSVIARLSVVWPSAASAGPCVGNLYRFAGPGLVARFDQLLEQRAYFLMVHAVIVRLSVSMLYRSQTPGRRVTIDQDTGATSLFVRMHAVIVRLRAGILYTQASVTTVNLLILQEWHASCPRS
jgi:hypothetical protein